jgi:hypothetical protein
MQKEEDMFTMQSLGRACVLVMLLAALLPGAANAGGWSVIVLDQQPGEVQAGVPFSVGFTVLQHGETPVDGLTPKISLISASTGATAQFTARAMGAPGHYVADLTLPSGGEWTWEIDAYGPPSPMSPIQVGAPAAAAQPAMQPAPAALPWLALAVLVAGMAWMARLVIRRRTAHTGV